MKVNIVVLFIVTTFYDGQFHFYQGAANAHLGLISGLNGNAGLSVTADLSKPRRILGGIFSHIGNKLSSGSGIQASANFGLGSGGSGNNDYGFRREYQNSMPNEYQWRPDISYSGSGDFRADLTQTHQDGNYPRGLETQYQPPPPNEHQRSKEIAYPSSIDFDIDRTHSYRTGNYPNNRRREQQRSPSHKHHWNRENSYSNTGDFDTDLTLTHSMRDHNRVSGHRRYPHLSDLTLPVIILNDVDSAKDKTKPDEIEGIVNQIEQTGNELIKAGEITASAYNNYSRGFRKEDKNTPPKEQRKNYENVPSAKFNVDLTHSHKMDDHDKPNENLDHRHRFKLPDLSELSSPKMSVLTSGRAYFSKDEMKQAEIEPPKKSGGRILGEYVSQMGQELRKAGILKPIADDDYSNNRTKENQRPQWNKNQQNPENVDSSFNYLGADLKADLSLYRTIGSVNGNDRNSETSKNLKLPDLPDQSIPKMSILTSSRTDTSQDKVDYDDKESTKKASGTFLGGIVSRIGNKLRGAGGEQAPSDGNISYDNRKHNQQNPGNFDSGSSHLKADLEADLTLPRPTGNINGNNRNLDTRQDLKLLDLPDLSSSRMPVLTSSGAKNSRDQTNYDENEMTKKASGTFLDGIVSRIGNKLRGSSGDQASTGTNIPPNRRKDNQRNIENFDSDSSHFKADLEADLTLSRPIDNTNGNDRNSDTRQNLNSPDLTDLSNPRMPASTSSRVDTSQDKTNYDENESTKKASGTFLGGIVSQIGNKLRGSKGDQASTDGNISNNRSKDNQRDLGNVDSGSGHLKADLEADLTLSRARNKAHRNNASSTADISEDSTNPNESEAPRKTGGRFLGGIVNRIGNKLSRTGGIHASASLTIGAGKGGSEEAENSRSTHDEPQHKLHISKVFNAFI
ncbi:uncharacterized protein LOC106656968 isoform X2 [Trichogramma pretiosum]|uniref:uncharacterized protein LOC106656968 isoform X2 n=1 Tax=Trichogramma pretiosum TaxID=7493 RepID=UPI0006C98BE1|nr:uncharacterized protein LOC106656968 isoform X2 [Trichogramma pretiosum]